MLTTDISINFHGDCAHSNPSHFPNLVVPLRLRLFFNHSQNPLYFVNFQFQIYWTLPFYQKNKDESSQQNTKETEVNFQIICKTQPVGVALKVLIPQIPSSHYSHAYNPRKQHFHITFPFHITFSTNSKPARFRYYLSIPLRSIIIVCAATTLFFPVVLSRYYLHRIVLPTSIEFTVQNQKWYYRKWC